MGFVKSFLKLLSCMLIMAFVAGIALFATFILEQPTAFLSISIALCLLWLTVAIVYFLVRFLNIQLKKMQR